MLPLPIKKCIQPWKNNGSRFNKIKKISYTPNAIPDEMFFPQLAN